MPRRRGCWGCTTSGRSASGARVPRRCARCSTTRGAAAPDGTLEATVVADAFCHSMVRSLVGAVVPVGEGRRAVEWPAEVLRAAVRDTGVVVMPPHGLSLEEVSYPDAPGWPPGPARHAPGAPWARPARAAGGSGNARGRERGAHGGPRRIPGIARPSAPGSRPVAGSRLAGRQRYRSDRQEAPSAGGMEACGVVDGQTGEGGRVAKASRTAASWASMLGQRLAVEGLLGLGRVGAEEVGLLADPHRAAELVAGGHLGRGEAIVPSAPSAWLR